MLTRRIDESPSVAAAVDGFLDAVGAWATDSVEEFSTVPPLDVHDQGTFTTGWEPYIRATRDPRAFAFMTELRDKIHRHFVDRGAFVHGYWTMQEAHHGTEHFELFLGTLWRLDPQDAETARQLVDAAEHFGNWEPSVPAWFDWTTGLFRSMFFGTGGVRVDPDFPLNVPDHLRCINICLLAYAITGDARYLELSRSYGGRWADAILADARIPIALDPGGPVYRFDGAASTRYYTFVGQAPPTLEQAIDRAENILASGGLNSLLRLWQLTREPRFRSAAEKLLDVISLAVADPDAGAAADAIRTYRQITGDNRYDSIIIKTVQTLTPFDIRDLAIDPTPPRNRRASGIGKRADAPVWIEDGRERQNNPILLAVAAELTDDVDLAARARWILPVLTFSSLERFTLPDATMAVPRTR